MRRIGLRTKFIALLCALLILIFSTVTTVLVQRSSANLRNDLDLRAKSFATLGTKPIADTFLLYKDSGRVRITQQVNRYLEIDPDVEGVAVVDVNGKKQFDSGRTNAINITQADAASSEPLYIYNEKHQITGVVQPYIEDFGAHRYAVVYQISHVRVDSEVRQVVILNVALGLSAMVLSTGLSYALINRMFLRRVREVSESALIVSQGDLSEQAEVDKNDEIGDLARAVNNMAASLKADIEKLQEVDKMKNEFMMIISHNLRTPLSIMSGYLEMSKDMKLTDELKNLLETLSANTIRLNTFAESVLAISSFEAGNFVASREPMLAKPIMERLVEDFSVVAERKNLQFMAEISLNQEKIETSHNQLRTALWNLLDNAYKFTPEKGHVWLNISIENNMLKVVIKDTGIGISEEEKPKLFTKFHRGTPTDTYDYEGTGIGLYLAKLIIENLGGRIEVESTLGKGSAFTVWLQIAKQV